MHNIQHCLLVAFLFWGQVTNVIYAQRPMTLEEAIGTARSQSVAALQAKHAFVSTYWAWRSYQASRLPLLTLYGDLGNFNRSQTLLQNFESGEMVYANSFNMQNSLGLALTQNIALTGGTLSLNSDLSRIDQYGVNRNLTWYAQPVTVSYRQPLFSFNPFKWDKLISPKEYEVGRRTYLESMEQITLNTVASYFRLMLAQMNLGLAVFNLLPVPPLDGYRFLDQFVFKGRLAMNQQTMFYIQIGFLIICMSGLLSGLLTTVNRTVMDGLTSVISLII
jgi:hypothetical protein